MLDQINCHVRNVSGQVKKCITIKISFSNALDDLGAFMVGTRLLMVAMLRNKNVPNGFLAGNVIDTSNNIS